MPNTDQASVYPSVLQGQVHQYKAHYHHDNGHHFWGISLKHPIRFNQKIDYLESVLVHQQGGGGQSSLFACQRMRLKDHLIDRIEARLRTINSPYLGIHIRNTDHAAEAGWPDTVASFARSSQLPVFIATDNPHTWKQCQDILGQRMVSFTQFNTNTSQPLHTQDQSPEQIDQRNIDAILDLMTLALSYRLTATKIQSTQLYSGYSLLAMNLHRHRPILHHVLGGSPFLIYRHMHG